MPLYNVYFKNFTIERESVTIPGSSIKIINDFNTLHHRTGIESVKQGDQGVDSPTYAFVSPRCEIWKKNLKTLIKTMSYTIFVKIKKSVDKFQKLENRHIGVNGWSILQLFL